MTTPETDGPTGPSTPEGAHSTEGESPSRPTKIVLEVDDPAVGQSDPLAAFVTEPQKKSLLDRFVGFLMMPFKGDPDRVHVVRKTPADNGWNPESKPVESAAATPSLDAAFKNIGDTTMPFGKKKSNPMVTWGGIVLAVLCVGGLLWTFGGSLSSSTQGIAAWSKAFLNPQASKDAGSSQVSSSEPSIMADAGKSNESKVDDGGLFPPGYKAPDVELVDRMPLAAPGTTPITPPVVVAPVKPASPKPEPPKPQPVVKEEKVAASAKVVPAKKADTAKPAAPAQTQKKKVAKSSPGSQGVAYLPLAKRNEIASPSVLADRIRESLRADPSGNRLVRGANLSPNGFLQSVKMAGATVDGVAALPMYLSTLVEGDMPRGVITMTRVKYSKSADGRETYTLDAVTGYARAGRKGERGWYDANTNQLILAGDCSNSPLAPMAGPIHEHPPVVTRSLPAVPVAPIPPASHGLMPLGPIPRVLGCQSDVDCKK